MCTRRAHGLGLICFSALAACSNGSGSVEEGTDVPPPVGEAVQAFAVGGTVTGLVGSGLLLQNNETDALTISSNGRFTFQMTLTSGAPYRVTVRTQPSDPAQSCTVARGTGTVGDTNVTNVRVTCAANTQSVGGAVTGLLGSGLVLQNNGADELSINEDGPFTFGTEFSAGTTYSVTVRTQPSDPDQACSIANGRGTVGSVDVTDVSVRCTTSELSIGGTVRGLEGSGLVLRNNNSDELTVDSSGTFTFDAALPSGATYDVSIAEQPRDPSQSCTVESGSGVVASRNVTDILVSCSIIGFAVGGHVSDLRGSGLILQNNGDDDLAIASNGRFRFPTALASGASYNVTVLRQPISPAQTCNVEHGAGTIGHSDVRAVEVKCERTDDDEDDDDDD